MAAPGMDNDFQLFSPRRSSGGDESRGMCSPQSSDNATQDWTQWMRWDEPMFQESNPTSQPLTSAPSVSPNTTICSPSFLHNKDFSPQLPLGLIEIPPEHNVKTNTFNTRNFGGHSQQSGLVSPTSTVGTSRKRKTSSGNDGSTLTDSIQPGKRMPPKKRAHNVIEKRYRANLNEKIAELRDSVPSLRATKKAGGDSNDDGEEDGTSSTNKLNKASILSKATEYIKHLEIRNKRLDDENTALKNRLRQVDKAADQAVTSSASVSSPSNYTASSDSNPYTSPGVFSNTEEITSEGSPTSANPPEGLIPTPDAWKRMRAEGAKSGSFAESYIRSAPRAPKPGREDGAGRRSKLPNKYMLGALAGLMVFEGFGSGKSETEEKGLLAIPLNVVTQLRSPSLWHWEYFLKSFWYSWHARAISHFLVLATLVVGSAFVVFLYLFNAQPVTQRTPAKSLGGKAAALTSSDFRRQAWLTSMQRVGVPRHRFFREWYVVTSRCFEYVLRCLMGWKVYSWATGITEEDEKGRVKTWDIAIDAQLTGGDAEISKSRLVLTIFAAGTLPRSPMRMMLKALHVRILLWRVGEPGSWTFDISNDIARALAKYQWAIAREIDEALPEGHPDRLPSHLATLIKLDCEDVMIDAIIQRAVNLTWNRPTQEGAGNAEALLDVVEEDPAIQCSVDALAAWWSSHLLQNALLKYMEASAGSPVSKKSRDVFKKKIRMALDAAPRLSAAYARALVMKAVFFEQDRVQNVGAVLATLPQDKRKSEHNHAANFLDSSLPTSVREEISIAVRCAMIAAVLTSRSDGDDSLPASFTIEKAITWFNQLPIDPVELSLLGFSAVYHLLHLLVSDVDYIASSESSGPPTPTSEAASGDEEAGEKSRARRTPAIRPLDVPNLGFVTAELIYWARNAYNPTFYGFSPFLVEVIVNSCATLCADAGIDINDYLQKTLEPFPPRKRRHRQRRGGSDQLRQSDADRELIDTGNSESSRRERSASNDTGYGSLSLEEEIQSVANVPGKLEQVSF